MLGVRWRRLAASARHGLATALVAPYLRLLPSHRESGIRVVFSDLDADRVACSRTIRAALALLQAADPRSHGRVLRYTRHLVIWAGHYTAYDSAGGVHVSSSYLADVSASEFAGALVHDAAHLRIAVHRIPYAAAMRSRIEALCVRQQADFFRRLPNPGLAEAAERVLEDPWWTDRHRRDDIARLVSDHSLPRWIGRLLTRMRTRDVG